MVRTHLIHTHGWSLAATVNPLTLHKQVHTSKLSGVGGEMSLLSCLQWQLAISYGYGVDHWGTPTFNCICVPNALFNVTEDPSQ